MVRTKEVSNKVDILFVAQNEAINSELYANLPLDRVSIYQKLVFPRMIYCGGRFRSVYEVYGDVLAGRRNDSNGGLRVWDLASFTGPFIASYLKHSGIHAVPINNLETDWQSFAEIYRTSEPLVGISTTFNLGFAEVTRTIKKIRKEFSACRIVLGGAFIANLVKSGDEDSLTTYMKKYTVEFALYDENSEQDLSVLVGNLKAGRNPADGVKNLIYIDRESSEMIRGEMSPNPPVIDLRYSFDEMKYFDFLDKTFQMRTSVGCPFACEFCSYPDGTAFFCQGSLDVLSDNLANLEKASNVENIIFIDDNFNVPVKRFIQLCTLLKKFSFRWFCFLRAQYVDDDVAKLMKEAGCEAVYLGIESANNKILKAMNKKVTKERYLRGIASLKKFGIKIMAAFVLGFPGETAETIQENIHFIEECGFDFYTLKEFSYINNTPVHDKREMYGLSGGGADWRHYSMTSEEAFEHKMKMLCEIQNSTYFDSDTSLWGLVRLLESGFSYQDIKGIQRLINSVVVKQFQGDYNTDALVSEILLNKTETC